jgi:Domain of unknown function (DUF4224)
MIWLDENEITRLTGYKQPSKQIAWLSANGHKFTVSGEGRPLIPASQFGVQSKPKGKAPDFGAINGKAA